MEKFNLIISAIKDSEIWNNTVNVFKKNKHYDIYFDLNFHLIHCLSSDSVLAFIYKANNDYFFLPFLTNKINNTEFYDFETIMGYSGPLTTNLDYSFLKKSWYQFYEELKSIKIIAGLIRFNPILKNHNTYINSPNFTLEKIKKTLYLDYRDNNYDKGFSKNVFRNLNKAKKNLLYLDKDQTIENFNIFFKIYNSRMNSKKAEERFFFKKEYFTKLMNNYPNNTKILIAKKNNEIVGGIIGIFSQNIGNVHLSAYSTKGLNYGVAYYLRYELIKELENCVDILHFGGGNSNNDDDSLLTFKKNFSRNFLDFYIGKFIIDSNIYNNLIKDWKNTNSDKANKYKNYFLKYRF